MLRERTGPLCASGLPTDSLVDRPARFGPEAAAELEEATRWYDQRRAGLGLALLAAVDEAVDWILRWPEAGAPSRVAAPELGVRQVPVPHFPYHLPYVVTDVEIHILAVAHNRREPGYWVGRIEGR